MYRLEINDWLRFRRAHIAREVKIEVVLPELVWCLRLVGELFGRLDDDES